MRPLLLAWIAALLTLLLVDVIVIRTGLLAATLRVESEADLHSPRVKLLLAPHYADAAFVVLGDSRARAFDPAAMSTACACGSGFNAAFASADTRLDRVMLQRLLEVMKPRLVVVGLSQWDLSDGADVQVHVRAPDLVPPWEFSAYRVRDYFGLADEARAALATVWGVYRYRFEIQSTIRLAPNGVERFERGLLAADGVAPSDELDVRIPAAVRQFFPDFSVEGRRAQALRDLVTDAQARGIRVLLVGMPIHPRLGAAASAQTTLFGTALRALGAAGGAETVDFSVVPWIVETDFKDSVHLNRTGARKLSEHVGSIIGRRGQP